MERRTKSRECWFNEAEDENWTLLRELLFGRDGTLGRTL